MKKVIMMRTSGVGCALSHKFVQTTFGYVKLKLKLKDQSFRNTHKLKDINVHM